MQRRNSDCTATRRHARALYHLLCHSALNSLYAFWRRLSCYFLLFVQDQVDTLDHRTDAQLVLLSDVSLSLWLCTTDLAGLSRFEPRNF